MEVKGLVTYKLELLAYFKAYPVFNVLALKRYIGPTLFIICNTANQNHVSSAVETEKDMEIKDMTENWLIN